MPVKNLVKLVNDEFTFVRCLKGRIIDFICWKCRKDDLDENDIVWSCYYKTKFYPGVNKILCDECFNKIKDEPDKVIKREIALAKMKGS